MGRRVYLACLLSCLCLFPLKICAADCLPSGLWAVFSEAGTSVTVKSTKELSNVVLKFCDGSSDHKFDSLSGYELTFSWQNKLLAGVWIKSGCNESGDGPGYGQFFGQSCGVPTPEATATSTPVPTVTPTPECTPTPGETPETTPTPTPTATNTPTGMVLCHIPDGVSAQAYTIIVNNQAELEEHMGHGDATGQCPLDCMDLPYGRAVIDQCGVCGGDGTSCLDCAEVPYGEAVRDACGVCNGDGKSCAGCDNLPNSQKVLDLCGICGGDNSTCLDCEGVPNGGKAPDQCGICGGSNSTCLDCAGVPNGKATIDACGVCGGNNTEPCLTISSCPGGSIDKCGVCGGNNACLDCAGIPNGGNIIDCCGVCGGDGSTCLDQCKFFNLKSVKNSSISSFKKLLKTIKKYSAQEAACNKNRARSAASRVKLAKKLSEQSESLLTLYIADSFKLCQTVFCAKTSFTSVLSKVKRNTKQIMTLSRNSQYGAEKACQTKKVNPRRTSLSYFGSAVNSLGKIPSQRCD